MFDWNVVVSVHDDGYKRARQILGQFGELKRTDFYNVMVLRVEDPPSFLKRLATLCETVPDILKAISRAMPATVVIDFQSAEEFEAKARDAVLAWTPALANKSFHVRMHRRGFKELMSSQVEERFLDKALLAALQEADTPGRITFEDPDVIIDVETVNQRAGLSLWTREDLQRYPFLKLD